MHKHEPILRVTDIEKKISGVNILKGITFEQFPGEVIALLGPSGCGKSTLLAIIAGIETPDQGSIFWKGVPINDLPPHKRDFGLMFQEDVLFPHMDVFGNVAFGLKMQKRDEQYIRAEVNKTLALVGLGSLGSRDVNTLSGGEQQRVALARSIAPQPGLLMLDEPLSSLDRTLRERLLWEIKRILKDLKQTAIYVTHDQEEAFSIADRIVLMRSGQIEQIGPPEEIYNHPLSSFAAEFLGLSNLITGRVIQNNSEILIESILGQTPYNGDHQGPITLLIRPDAAVINGEQGIHFRGRIVERTFQGNLCHVAIATQGTSLKFVFLMNADIPDIGDEVQFSIDPDGIVPILDNSPNIKWKPSK